MAARIESGDDKYKIDLQPDLIVAALRPDLEFDRKNDVACWICWAVSK